LNLFFKVFAIITIISILLTGCLPNKTPAPSQQPNQATGPKQPKEEEPVKKPNSSDPSDTVKPTDLIPFEEAFPLDQILHGTEEFIDRIIPGFRIGMSKEGLEDVLGTPDLIRQVQEEYGEKFDWVYEDVKGYRLIATFNSEQQIKNFKLSRYFGTKGIVPVIINKAKPEPGSPIEYRELGFEEIVLGNKLDEVLTKYGEPSMSYISYDDMYGYDLAMVYSGVTVHILLENDNPYVHFIEANSYNTVDTYRGIHVGSDVVDVLQSYGEPKYNWEETGDLIYATNDLWFAIRFEIKDAKVTHINIYEAS